MVYKSFFNEVFDKFARGIGLNVSRLKSYIDKVYQQRKASLEYAEKERYENIICAAPHYSRYQCPRNDRELDVFLGLLEEYLGKNHTISVERPVDGSRLMIVEIFSLTNEKLREKGFPEIVCSSEMDCVKKVLKAAWQLRSLSEASDSFPLQYFSADKLVQGAVFVGRGEQVNALVQGILAGRSYYLQGIGGIGKTEIMKAVVGTISQMSVLVQTYTSLPSGAAPVPVIDILWVDLNTGSERENEGVMEQRAEIELKICRCFDSNHDPDDFVEKYRNCREKMLAMGSGLLIVIDNIEAVGNLREFCQEFANARFLLGGRPNTLNLPNQKFQTLSVSSLKHNDCKELFKQWYGDPLCEGDEEAIDKIIRLADRHTVTLELFAKLIRKQDFYEEPRSGRSSIRIFLDTLISCGFDLKFSDGEGGLQEDEPVSAEHRALRQEKRTIDQLAKLFSTISLNDERKREALIKLSTVPNLPFSFKEANQLLFLHSKQLLDDLSEAGWLQRKAGTEKTYSIHSVIAAAIRHENLSELRKSCRKIVVAVTKRLKRPFFSQVKKELLTQFSWSIADVFGGDIDETDADFIERLIGLYEEIHLNRKAEALKAKLYQLPKYSLE